MLTQLSPLRTRMGLLLTSLPLSLTHMQPPRDQQALAGFRLHRHLRCENEDPRHQPTEGCGRWELCRWSRCMLLVSILSGEELVNMLIFPGLLLMRDKKCIFSSSQPYGFLINVVFLLNFFSKLVIFVRTTLFSCRTHY